VRAAGRTDCGPCCVQRAKIPGGAVAGRRRLPRSAIGFSCDGCAVAGLALDNRAGIQFKNKMRAAANMPFNQHPLSSTARGYPFRHSAPPNIVHPMPSVPGVSELVLAAVHESIVVVPDCHIRASHELEDRAYLHEVRRDGARVKVGDRVQHENE